MKAVQRYSPIDDPRRILSLFGGFELCTIVGFILGLRKRSVACLIDGFPVTAAAYLAHRIDESVVSFLFAGHKSKVKGHLTALRAMQLEPILDLNMRLGEGTGAILGGQIVDLAVKLAGEMASFDEARVSRSDEVEKNY
jgi:nicotinate-nucleotide--dimethylbenzimidazole phosphoribosyltransferase